MTSMERVLAALKGEDADRRPFTMTLSLYGAKLTGCPLPDYYTQPEKYLQGQIAVSRQCKPDIIFAPFALALEAQGFGSEITFLEKSPPNVKKLLIRNLNELGTLKIPDMEKVQGLKYLITSTKLLAGHFKPTVPVCGVLTSPLDLPALIMGVENWLELLLFNREKALTVIDLMAAHFVRIANTMFENGAAFIAIPMMFCNPQILMKKTIVELVVPALGDIFAKVKGPIVFHHGGMPVTRYLSHYRNLPNVAGFVIDHRDNFAEARIAVGENMVLLGNLEGTSLGKISTAHALEKTKKILDNRKTDRHYIFATSNADVAWNTPLETITGIHDLIEMYGGTHA